MGSTPVRDIGNIIRRIANIPSPLDERREFSIIHTIIESLARNNMVEVAQLDRASDCGSECREFESPLPPFFY